MSSRWTGSGIAAGILFCILLVTVLFVTACVSTEIGNAGYDGRNLSIPLTHAGNTSDGYVQVTVYAIRNSGQEETGVLYAPLALEPGENRAILPASLEPGHYKLYIYLIQNGERKTAAIRDIVVN